MTKKPTILDRLFIFAEAGKTSSTLKLWKKQIDALIYKGFCITVISATNRKGEYRCLIDWSNPSGESAYELLGCSINATWFAA